MNALFYDKGYIIVRNIYTLYKHIYHILTKNFNVSEKNCLKEHLSTEFAAPKI